MKDKVMGLICLILGLLPYVLAIILLLSVGLGGTTKLCFFSVGADTTCPPIYGFEAISYTFSLIFGICYLFWYISVPIIILTIILIVAGIKLLLKNKRN